MYEKECSCAYILVLNVCIWLGVVLKRIVLVLAPWQYVLAPWQYVLAPFFTRTSPSETFDQVAGPKVHLFRNVHTLFSRPLVYASFIQLLSIFLLLRGQWIATLVIAGIVCDDDARADAEVDEEVNKGGKNVFLFKYITHKKISVCNFTILY